MGIALIELKLHVLSIELKYFYLPSKPIDKKHTILDKFCPNMYGQYKGLNLGIFTP